MEAEYVATSDASKASDMALRIPDWNPTVGPAWNLTGQLLYKWTIYPRSNWQKG